MSKYILFIVVAFSLVSCGQKVEKQIGLSNNVKFHIGTAVGYQQPQMDSLYNERLTTDFTSITAEGIMKMRAVLRSLDSLDFSKVDSFVDFAQTHQMRVHGHCLIWHQSTPPMVEALTDSAELELFMQRYIHQFVSRYKGKVESWDVVNEAVSDSIGLFRPSQWLNTLGAGYIERAFQYAHESDPEAKLFYNEYCIEQDSVKLKATLKLIDDMLLKGIPIHGIGFQMHTVVDTPAIEIIAASIDSFVKRGLLIHISELDVRLNRYNVPEKHTVFTPNLDSLQAERYYQIAKMYNQVVPDSLKYGITLWNFTDKYSWINRFYKTTDWATIYDENHQKKKSWSRFRLGLLNE